MLCLRCCRGLASALKPSSFPIRNSTKHPSIRTFTSLPTLRPSLKHPRASALTTSSTSTPNPSTATADLHPKLSNHPGLSSLQVRYVKRNTFSPSHFVRKRRYGFLSRAKTRKGRMTLRRRRLKGRSTLSH